MVSIFFHNKKVVKLRKNYAYCKDCGHMGHWKQFIDLDDGAYCPECTSDRIVFEEDIRKQKKAVSNDK